MTATKILINHTKSITTTN